LISSIIPDPSPPYTPSITHITKGSPTGLAERKMAAKTEAQEEFDSIVAKASASERYSSHPDDREDYAYDRDNSDRDEEDEFQATRVDNEMKFSFAGGANENHLNSAALKLPHKSFDSGRTTGVKGVIADARNYEEARRNGSWRNRIRESSVGKRASSLGLLRERDNGRERSGRSSWRGGDKVGGRNW
jgi:hypothetical protein